jgi:hypothetical protein
MRVADATGVLHATAGAGHRERQLSGKGGGSVAPIVHEVKKCLRGSDATCDQFAILCLSFLNGHALARLLAVGQRFKRLPDFASNPLEPVDPQTRMARIYDEWVHVLLHVNARPRRMRFTKAALHSCFEVTCACYLILPGLSRIATPAIDGLLQEAVLFALRRRCERSVQAPKPTEMRMILIYISACRSIFAHRYRSTVSDIMKTVEGRQHITPRFIKTC